MAKFDAADFKRLSLEVRRFLAKGDLATRISGMATLYLEFPDVGMMRHVHETIVQAMHDEMMRPAGPFWTYVDDHTIKYEPYAGVSIVLSCKQRFAVKTGGSVGYRDIAFRSVDMSDTNGPLPSPDDKIA